jgi:NADH-quinone oxidoreductase subunit M
MILAWLIAIPLTGGAAAWAAARWNPVAARWVALGAAAGGFVVSLVTWAQSGAFSLLPRASSWIAELDVPWVPQFGIHFHLALDGLSLLLVVLTFFLGIVGVLSSWTEIRTAVGFFHFNLLWILAGIVSVFLAVDLFLFYFAWELMLVPMYFLIALWGHERRIYAAVKFFIFTQLSGLLMLLSILGLYFKHHAATGVYTFQLRELMSTPMDPVTGMWLMLGFFVAFAVKLPVFPVHTWLPDAHTEAPTAGSVILAGLLLKTGAYGMIRFVVPLFPGPARELAPVAMLLAVTGILYGAILAFGQNDLKRLVAYTSVSHLGFVLLGVFTWNRLALQGAVLTMICHGLSTGALFFLVGALQERLHSRDMDRMSGLWATAPRLGGASLFFAMASLGLPGLGDFVGEFLVLIGAFYASVPMAVIASLGVLGATFYGLKIIQRAFHVPNLRNWKFSDLSWREMTVVAALALALIWLGLYPKPVTSTFAGAMEGFEGLQTSSLRDAQPGSGGR